MLPEYIENKTIQLNQQSEKEKCFLEAIMKSDSNTFDKLLSDDPLLIYCSIPPDYNYSNIYQIIVEHSTYIFIDNVFSKYFNMINDSTECGKNLVPVACERGDENILKIILKYFPFAPLNGITNSNKLYNYSARNKPHEIELSEYKNDIPLLYVIRDDRPDLLVILFKFKPFQLDYLTKEEKQKIFHLCLLTEHRRITMDQYNLRWFKNQSLSPCGSIECLHLIIEYAHFNPLHFQSSISPFALILKPIDIYIKHVFYQIYDHVDIKIPAHIIVGLYNLIKKQMNLFIYLITYCCFVPTDYDITRLSELKYYVKDIFYATKYLSIENFLSKVIKLAKRDKKNNKICLTLKEICRCKIRDHLRTQGRILVQVENRFDLNFELNKYLKFII